jgi:hypothetical protein
MTRTSTLGASLALLLTLLPLGPSASAWAQDDDEIAREIARKSGLWVLGFEHDGPRWISLNRDRGRAEGKLAVPGGGEVELDGLDEKKLPGEFGGGARQLRVANYWYLFYTVTNKDEEDHRLFVDVTASSDKSRRYHDVYDPAVHRKIEEILRSRGKLGEGEKLHSQIDLNMPTQRADLDAAFPRKLSLPMIKAGESKKCVAIFQRFDPEMDTLKIHVEGLQNDVIVEAPKDYRRTVREQILELVYERLGNEFFTASNKLPRFVSRKWKTRETTVKTDLKKP